MGNHNLVMITFIENISELKIKENVSKTWTLIDRTFKLLKVIRCRPVRAKMIISIFNLYFKKCILNIIYLLSSCSYFVFFFLLFYF